MPHAPQPARIETEVQAQIERFTRYLAGTRYGRKRSLRANTVRSYAGVIRALIAWSNTPGFTVAQAQGYLEHLSNRVPALSASTKRSAYFAVKAWFEWKREPITDEQEENFLVPPTPNNAREAPLRMERIHELLGAIPDRRRYAIIRTFLATGIRRAELAALKVKHIDFTAGKVWVPEIGEDGRAAAKGGNGGWVCISTIALNAIREHLGSRRDRGQDPEAPLFESLLTGGHLHPDSLSQLVGDLTEGILGKRVNCHDMRRAFASYAAAGDADRQPMPIKALQAQLRHRNANTTLRYVSAVGDHAEAYARSAPHF